MKNIVRQFGFFPHSQWWIVLFVPIVILYTGCGEDLAPEDTTPPSAPQIVPKSSESQFLQQGIDSEPGNSEQDYWIRLEWEWNSEPDLAGYYVYRMDERDSLGGYPFNRIKNLRVGFELRRDFDPIPYYTDQDPVLRPDQSTGYSHGFYYYIRAYDGSGNSSTNSDTAYYRLLQKPRGLTINGNTSSSFNLVWEYYGQENWNYFFIRVYPQGSPNIRVWSYRANLLVSPFSVAFNGDGTANQEYLRGQDSLIVGTYGWTVDVVADFDPEHPAGAETRSIFTVMP
jgi:hypothetical protein